MSLASLKSGMVFPFLCRITQFVLGKEAVKQVFVLFFARTLYSTETVQVTPYRRTLASSP